VMPKTERAIDLLVAHGLDVNQPDWRGRTFLHAAAESGDLEAAAAYLKHGADPNVVDVEFSHTPLGAAARRGKAEMVRFLLDRGADPKLPADRPWALPAAYAANAGHREIVAMLRAASG
jgi:ankyrin repeat protein